MQRIILILDWTLDSFRASRRTTFKTERLNIVFEIMEIDTKIFMENIKGIGLFAKIIPIVRRN